MNDRRSPAIQDDVLRPLPALSGGRYWWTVLVLAGVYFAAARFGLHLAVVHPSASAVWPPTGIAFAACLLLGLRAWPGILAGAFFANMLTTGNAATSLGIALGNTLEAVAGAWLVWRYAGGVRVFDNVANILRFIAGAGLLSTMASATIGVGTLALAGEVTRLEMPLVWLTWWLGDAAGNFVVGPLVVLWGSRRMPRWTARQAVEAGVLLLGLIAAGQAVWSGRLPPGATNSLGFLTIPLLVWIAFRFGMLEVATATFALSLLAVRGTLEGFGPFAAAARNGSLLLVQSFVSVVGMTAITMSAVILERRRAEAEKERLLDRERGARLQADAANRLKDEFLATVSHELRTPLSAIYGWARILGANLANPSQRQTAVASIEKNARSLARMVDDLLDVSKVAVGKLELARDPIDLAPLLRECVEAIRPAAESKEIAVHAAIPATLRFVAGDRERLKQVFGNLLSNAVKFTTPGGAVRVLAAASGARVEVAVDDTGRGIHHRFLPHVFDRFRQEDASASRDHGGLGLGLAIARELVRLHGGEISAESQGQGRGATFRVVLPLAEATHRGDAPGMAS